MNTKFKIIFFNRAHIKTGYLLIVLFLSNLYYLKAQKASLKFTHYGKQDGINQSSVNFIFQDHDHFLWVANFGGVNKFDGYKFTSYSNVFGDSTSISDNSVWTIFEGKDLSLWFGTKTGLSRFNREKNNFTNYYIRGNYFSTNNLAVKSIFEDAKGRFYIGSEGEGLFVFSKKNEVFYSVNLIPKEAKISAITEDSHNNLWVGTENLGLFKISPDRKKVISCIKEKSLTDNTIWSLYSDKKGNTWIGTDKNGLIKFEETKSHYIVFKNKNFKESLNYDSGNKIKTIIGDQKGKIWIGSATQGLSYFDLNKNQFYNYQHNPYQSNSLFDNDVSSIFPGYNDVLYVGFYMKGFDKVIITPFYTIRYQPGKQNSLSNNNVYCMYKDGADMLWFGTFGGGLNKYDPKSKTFKHYKNDPSDPKSISHNWVRIINEDSKGNLWVGTWGGGLNKFDRKRGTFKRYLPEEGNNRSINLNIVTAIFEDSDKELWIGTYGGGINIYQPESDDFISITSNNEDSNSLSDDHITSFYQDKEGLIWICTYGGGLNAYNKKTNSFDRFLPEKDNNHSLNNHKTLHIFNEPDSNFFWITTLGGGINKYNFKERRFYHFTEKEGLANNSTMGMLKDKNGNYWVSTNNGISRFNPKDQSFKNYTMVDGLGSDDYNLEAYLKTNSGEMYFGGKNGITHFNPDGISANETFPKVSYTQIKVGDVNLYEKTKEIIFPYKSHLVFEYAAVNANKVENIKYAYQLLGLSNKWFVEDEIRHLEFSNLDPGEYVLNVKSTNGNKIWSQNYRSIKLIVTPPWYMTWYFRIGSVIIVLLTGYIYYRWKLNAAEALNRLLSQKVEARTNTIKEQNQKLYLEKEKTEVAYKKLQKLESFKNELTAMIVHDLKNPLVTILSNSSDQTDRNLSGINKSGKTMLNLIENMLDVQKFEDTEVKLNVNSYNLRTIIKEAINNVSVIANEKRVQMINLIDASLYVKIDVEIILRVYINLFSNAIKYSEHDSKIEIEHQFVGDSKDVIVKVRDFGKGIPEKHLLTIFDKFSQVEAVKSGNIKSSGLGLTFCRMAVEAHKGKIWASSVENNGSTFYTQLPLDNNINPENQDVSNVESENASFTNPLLELNLTEDDLSILNHYDAKIKKLSIYEMGEWLEIFELLEPKKTVNIRKWIELMTDSLYTFDESAFTFLTEKVVKSTNNSS